MKRRQKQKRGGITLGFIVKIVIGLVILGLLLCIIAGKGPLCQNSVRQQMKDLLGSLAGKPTEDPGCVPYHTIDYERNLTAIISKAAVGMCAGDTTQSAFRLNITSLTSINFHTTDTTSDEFCGTHTYEVGGLNWTITFGDVEWGGNTVDCGYNGEDILSFGLETQDCVPNNMADLVITGPAWLMDEPCGPFNQPTMVGCKDDNTGWLGLTSHLRSFALYEKPDYWGSWYIKRAGEDTVLCFITKEKEVELGLRTE